MDPLAMKEEEERMKAYKSHYGEYSSTVQPLGKNLGSIDGLSQIMRRSEETEQERYLIEENDSLHLYSEIKEMFRAHYNSYDDLL